ncbi:PAS domain S-box protein [Candidatus Poribacteria bacterium]|nr:PAS domain S-box protein [Candidatus Poribacteria bacterium]
MKKRTFYPIVGAMLGTGAAVGAILARYFTADVYDAPSHFITHEIGAHLYFYLYMASGTIVVLMLSGFFIGKLQDHLIEQNRQLDLANQDLNHLLSLHAESEESYRKAIEQASDAILFVEIETAQILDANAKATELTGYTRFELCQLKIWEIYPQGDIENMQAFFKETQSTGEAMCEDLTFVRRDGKRIHVEVCASVIEYNKTPAIQQIWHDVTERKYLEQQLRHADKLTSIGRLASGIAHEIGNPLGSISAYAQILLMGGESEAERIEYLRAIESESKRIGELLKHLLNFSRPTADSIEWVDVNGVIEQALALVSAQKKFRAIQVTKIFDTPSPRVRIDSDQLKQVLINLLLNAADAMPDGGELTVQSHTDAKFVCMSVTDTGTGIKPADRDRIFDPFFTTKPDGTGLGLAMSARLIEKYGGVIEVKSEEGKGSTFTVLLPKSLEVLDLVLPSVEIEPKDQSIWSIEYPNPIWPTEQPNFRKVKALPAGGVSEGEHNGPKS